MGGYPSSASSASGNNNKSRGGYNNEENDPVMILPSNSATTGRASKSQSESLIYSSQINKRIIGVKEGSGPMTQSLGRLLNQPSSISDEYDDDDKSDAFALDPDGMYSTTTATRSSNCNNNSQQQQQQQQLYNSTSYPSISFSTSSQPSLSSSSSQQQFRTDISISLEGEILQQSPTLNTSSSRRKSRPAIIQTDSDYSSSTSNFASGSRGVRTVIVENSNQQGGDGGCSLMVAPLMHSNSVRIKKKPTSQNEIDDILNTPSLSIFNNNGKNSSLSQQRTLQKSPHPHNNGKVKSSSKLFPASGNQWSLTEQDEEEDGGIRQVHSFNSTKSSSSSKKKSSKSDKPNKMSQEMDNYIDSILKKKGKSADDLSRDDTEGEINDFRETNLPILVGQEPVLYHAPHNESGYLGRRRKSTVAIEQENPEQHAMELENVFRRTRSTINTKNVAVPAGGGQPVEIPETSVQPVSNPMIVVSGGAKLLRKDKSLYTVGGVINDKKKTELEKRRRKAINRSKVVGKIGPLISVDSDTESEEEEEDRPEDLSSQCELQTEYCE
ncbi:hypothetical protein C9374_011105 [Naegleria lovaniensis]|uniref:Uncharacterized protein n=1 Tax=Naegleria lovaniensis TaxID=51637 RepID=A0AA88GH55_NAELO|nr:uncharacterized protein C9374_011105 [Naegleria lovaniensis]KAG2374026.1 hypothetical protein C9374_011105 [Naegleria lovaniensis]